MELHQTSDVHPGLLRLLAQNELDTSDNQPCNAFEEITAKKTTLKWNWRLTAEKIYFCIGLDRLLLAEEHMH